MLSLQAFTVLAGIFLDVPTGVVADRIGLKRSVVRGCGLEVVWLLILMAAHALLRRIGALEALSDPLPNALRWLYQPYVERSGTPTGLYGLVAHRSRAPEARFDTVNRLPVAGYLPTAALAGADLGLLLSVATHGVRQLRYPLIAKMRNRRNASYNRATAPSVIAVLEDAWGMVMKLVAGYFADVTLALAFVALALVPPVAVVALPLREEHLRPAQAVSAGARGPWNGTRRARVSETRGTACHPSRRA